MNIIKVTPNSVATKQIVWHLHHSNLPLLAAMVVATAVADAPPCDKGSCNMDNCRLFPMKRMHRRPLLRPSMQREASRHVTAYKKVI